MAWIGTTQAGKTQESVSARPDLQELKKMLQAHPLQHAQLVEEFLEDYSEVAFPFLRAQAVIFKI